MSKYFAPSEFRACTPSCSIEQMDPRFLAQLDQVREVAGIPMVLATAPGHPLPPAAALPQAHVAIAPLVQPGGAVSYTHLTLPTICSG